MALKLFRGLVVAVGLVILWSGVTVVTSVPPYILPDPLRVAMAWYGQFALIMGHAAITVTEIIAGLVLGTLIGACTAIVVSHVRAAERWVMPVLVISQAIPVFALAPLLTLWFGYGMASKVAMATLIIYFPVAASFLDGLRRTEPGWLHLAQTMTAASGTAAGHRLSLLWHIRIPAALPALASGLRVAVAIAPIGAVVGEWVGSSAGLGYLMLHANARMQTDLMFAALFTLAAFSVALYLATDRVLRAVLPWVPDTRGNLDRS